jgi:class 3 adenylate cyclase
MPPAEVVPLLDRACAVGTLASDGVTFWFVHPHYREVLSSSLKPSSRAQIHLRCLRHIQSSSTATAERDHYAIGHHLLQARAATGSADRWIGLSRAGAAAIARADWVEAGRFLEAAIIDRPDDLPPKELALLHLRAGQAHFFSHDADAARRHLLAAIDLAKAEDDQRTWSLAARTLTRQDNTVNAHAYQRVNNMEVIRDFLDAVRDPVEKALALEVLAEAHSGAGLDEEADRLAGEAIKLLEGSGDDRALAMCHFSRAYGALAALRLRQGRSIETKVLFHTGRTGDWFVPMALEARLAFLHIGVGDLAGADRLASRSISVASAYHEFAALSLGHTVRAATAMLHGDFAEADRHADRAAAAARRCGHASAAYHLAPLRTALHLTQGRLDEAEAEADGWSGLPNAALAPLRAMIERRRASMISLPRRAPIRHVTWLGAGVLAAQVTDALEAGDTAWLESALRQLEAVQKTELVFTASFPSSMPRIFADALGAVERYDDALDLYRHVVPVLRDTGAYPELVRALIGQCRADSRARGGSRDQARRSATEALELARRLDLAPLRAEAAALLRRDIDIHPAVRHRQGEWRVILLTDIVASTSVSQHLGDLAYHQLVMQHHALVRRCVEEHGGHEFGDTGDGLFAWFSMTDEAVDTALAIQDEATLAPAQPSGHRLGVKVALSGGEPLILDDRPYGLIVNRAARLVALAKGGDIVADEAVTDDLDQSRVEITMGTPVELKGIGEHRPAWISGREDPEPGQAGLPSTDSDVSRTTFLRSPQ